ncbi:MAG: PAS domain-containing protein, partial [Dongiaceae bacterium]
MLLRRKRQQPPIPAPGDPSLVLEHLEAGVWDWDIVSGAVFLSPGWKRQIGFQDEELPASFAAFEKQIHPDDRDRVRKQREAARESGDDFYLTEFRLRHRDGSYRWIFCRARIVRDEEGRALRMVGVDADITERKRIEEALAGSEDRMRRTQQITKTAHWSWFPDRPGGDWRSGRILFETAADLFGVDAITVHLTNARYIEEFVHPDDRAMVARIFASSMGARDRRYEIEYRVIVGEREIKTIHEVAEVFRDKAGRVINAQGTIQDITDRKRMEEALSTSERRMRRAQHMAKIAHWVQRIENPDTPDRDVYEYSETAASIFGVELAALNSCSKGYVETFVHPADREKARRVFENVGTKEGPAYALEYRIICPDGQVKTVYEVAENAFDPTDGVLTMSGIVQDVTERKEMEEALTLSEGRMRRAQQIARLGHWILDAAADVDWGSTIAKWSENAAAIYGATPDELAITNNEYVQRFVHPADRKRLQGAYLAAEMAESGAGRPYRLEYRIIRSDGDVRTIYETAEPSHDARPGRIIWNGVIQDITERKRMEEALSISEGRMRRAQHMARMCHWVCETRLGASKGSAEVAHYSASATELFGFEPERLTLPDFEFIRRYVHPADQERVAGQYLEMHDQGSNELTDFQIEFRMVMRDGSIKFVNEIAEPSLEAKPGWIVWQGVIQDITERKQMEQALYLSESRMRRAQHIARLGHWVTLRSNTEPAWRQAISEYSDSAAEIFGVAPEDLSITNEQYIQRFVHPADREMVAATFEASSENDGGFRLEYRVVTPSGEVRTVY